MNLLRDLRHYETKKNKKYFPQERKKMIEEQVIPIWSCLLAFMTKFHFMDYVICEKR